MKFIWIELIQECLKLFMKSNCFEMYRLKLLDFFLLTILCVITKQNKTNIKEEDTTIVVNIFTYYSSNRTYDQCFLILNDISFNK